MLGGVEPQNILALARSRIDGPHVFAPVHLPDCCHYSIFLNGVVRDIFRRDFCRRTLTWCFSRAFNQRAFIL